VQPVAPLDGHAGDAVAEIVQPGAPELPGDSNGMQPVSPCSAASADFDPDIIFGPRPVEAAYDKVHNEPRDAHEIIGPVTWAGASGFRDI
jgi:hypothetical protein